MLLPSVSMWVLASNAPATSQDVVASAFADMPAKTEAAMNAGQTAAPAIAQSAAAAGGSLTGTIMAVALILALAAVAGVLFFRKRRLAPTQGIQLLETLPLGPKRSLVLARVGNEVLLLGSSEGGINVLSVRQTQEHAGHDTQPVTLSAVPSIAGAPAPSPRMTVAAEPDFAFESALRSATASTNEDAELRAKLAMLDGARR